jgi:Flp pilus assembly protein TadB
MNIAFGVITAVFAGLLALVSLIIAMALALPIVVRSTDRNARSR